MGLACPPEQAIVKRRGTEVAARWKAAAVLAVAATAAGLAAVVGPAGSAPAGTGQTVTAAASSVRHRTLTGNHDVTLRAKASDTQLVIGTGLRGVPMDVTSVTTKGFRKAYVYGHVQHCLWLVPGTGTVARRGDVRHDCASFTFFSVRAYAKRVNCLPQGRKPAYLDKHYPQSTRCTDGSPARIKLNQRGCREAGVYANIQPWHNPARPADQYGTLANGTNVKWRYIARDTNWVLVHGPTLHPGQSHWYYVPRACVSAPNVHNPKAPYRPLVP
jgi:hypothetical protein